MPSSFRRLIPCFSFPFEQKEGGESEGLEGPRDRTEGTQRNLLWSVLLSAAGRFC